MVVEAYCRVILRSGVAQGFVVSWSEGLLNDGVIGRVAPMFRRRLCRQPLMTLLFTMVKAGSGVQVRTIVFGPGQVAQKAVAQDRCILAAAGFGLVGLGRASPKT